jgi:oligopeptide transport system ATP-binding protein
MPSIRANGERTLPLLAVRDLTVEFELEVGVGRAVDAVSFEVGAGEILGIVGESGSGKSQILLATMGLTAQNGRCSGSVRFCGDEILNAPGAKLDRLRGAAMAMIFQDPLTSLNPYLRVREQLIEKLVTHRLAPRREAEVAALDLLDRVRIPDPARRMTLYPHQLSGGMRQRVMIAMALLGGPALLLADEPTTALDVTVQADILELLAGLVRDLGTAVVIVTHDLGVIARLCDRVVVLYGGRIVEEAAIDALFEAPRHPYTQGLLASTLRIDDPMMGELRPIPGSPPGLTGRIEGCAFAPRCPLRIARCDAETPALLRRAGERAAACHRVTS